MGFPSPLGRGTEGEGLAHAKPFPSFPFPKGRGGMTLFNPVTHASGLL
jgi:hypothetical protein